MRLRKALDRYYQRGFRDGITGNPVDPFGLGAHRDRRHLRRAYDAGLADGRRQRALDMWLSARRGASYEIRLPDAEAR